MPEYLAPGVYVEEVDTGSKPIEGVSTTTSGMVGVTERGPVNVPTLVTGTADYKRQFGWYLDRRIYTGGTWYLPHAVKGFFDNGGKRLYIVRVLPDTASASAVLLFDRGNATGVATRAVTPVLAGQTALIVERTANINDNDWLRIDDDKFTEFVQADTTPVPALVNRGIRALRAPLYFNHSAAGAGTPMVVVTLAATPNPNDLATTLNGNVSAGETRIRLTSRTNVNADDILSIGAVGSANREFATVASVPADPADLTVTLRHLLAFNHLNLEVVTLVSETATAAATRLDQNANAGTALIVAEDVGALGVNFDPADIVRFGNPTDADREYHVVADSRSPAVGVPPIPVAFALRNPAYANHPTAETITLVAPTVTLGGTAFDQALASPAEAGDRIVTLVSRGNLIVGDFVSVGAGASQEFLVVAQVPADPADMSITLNQPLAFDHAATTDHVILLDPPVGANATTSEQAIRRGQSLLIVADGTGLTNNVIVEIGAANSPTVEYQTLGNAVDIGLIGITGLAGNNPTGGFTNDHVSGVEVIERAPLLTVQGIDPGAWGNTLRVTVDDDTPILDTTAAQLAPIGSPTLQLTSSVGVEPGTILDFYQMVSGNPQTVFTQKVETVTGSTVGFGAATLSQGVAQGMRIRTREFVLTVDTVKFNPRTQKEEVVGGVGEVLRHLSMDPRHSRYVMRVAGPINPTLTNPLRDDGRTDGESNFIRVDDALTPAQAQAALRLGPDLLTETLPTGRRIRVPQRLQGGDDQIGLVTDATYIGLDFIDPLDRTGIFALKNIEEISIVAVPGRTSQQVQQELIIHCELMRYRFAVLDSRVTDGVAEVQTQRGLYDTKYAALYYPWLRIVDPFPDNPRAPGVVEIPPSGHMIGIYARSDIERGVHKAPANEVIRGIADLEFKLTKEEQDILNPRNIDVLRNFRANNRGLRVWGARTLSSDPDWKYINVRRLFIFVEHSIDNGTQWVVFEPNSDPLWERVRGSVSSFLNQVWRDGALMGKTREEAYFVKCDRTTMTQNDIDNGRLVVLVGIAPVKPAEFVIFRIGQKASGSDLEEG
jgi:phage tail sheath protein FI